MSVARDKEACPPRARSDGGTAANHDRALTRHPCFNLERARSRQRYDDLARKRFGEQLPIPFFAAAAQPRERRPARRFVQRALRWPAATLDRTRPRVAGLWQLSGNGFGWNRGPILAYHA
jgi:hypothetical protein